MQNPFTLNLVTDRDLISPKNFMKFIEACANSGVTCVQVREKNICTRDFVSLAKDLKTCLKKYSIPLIINDRVDVALASHADGVHLGQSDLSYKDARKILGEDCIIGLTLNTVEDAWKAKDYDVNYYGVGAIFPTSTKKDIKHIWSKREVQKIRSFLKKPLMGIGGLHRENVEEVMQWGLDGIAVVSELCAAKDLEDVKKRTQDLRKILDGAVYEYI